MITTSKATVPVSSEQALNALADREFLAECVTGVTLEAGGPGDLLRGTITCGEPAATYQFGLRLIEFDLDGRSLRYEALARQVDGRGLARMSVDLDMSTEDAKTTVAVNSSLGVAGLRDRRSYAEFEQAVSETLLAFVARASARLGADTGRTWRAPGATATGNEAAVAPSPAAPKTVIGPIRRRAILPLTVIGGVALSSYLIWRAIRVVGRKAGSRGAGA